MRKIRNAVARQIQVQFPAHLFSLGRGVIVKHLAGGFFIHPFLAHQMKQLARIRSALGVGRIVAGDESIAAVTFPLLEYRTDINQEDVVRA